LQPFEFCSFEQFSESDSTGNIFGDVFVPPKFKIFIKVFEGLSRISMDNTPVLQKIGKPVFIPAVFFGCGLDNLWRCQTDLMPPETTTTKPGQDAGCLRLQFVGQVLIRSEFTFGLWFAIYE
jgi:hypothetical protein